MSDNPVQDEKPKKKRKSYYKKREPTWEPGKHPGGAPSLYTYELAVEIAKRVANEEFLTDICKDPNMPSYSAVNVWLNKHIEFKELYVRAKEEMFDRMAHGIIQLADQFDGDKTVLNSQVQAVRLQIDARKWLLSRAMPRKYGDQIQVDHSGGVEITGITRKIVDPVTIDNEADRKLHQAITHKRQQDQEISDADYDEHDD